MEAILDEAGVSVTPEQLASIVDGVEGASSMEYEATGRDCIPHPFEAERRDLQRQIKSVRAEADQARDDFRTNVSNRWNVRPDQVVLDGPDATIYP